MILYKKNIRPVHFFGWKTYRDCYVMYIFKVKQAHCYDCLNENLYT